MDRRTFNAAFGAGAWLCVLPLRAQTRQARLAWVTLARADPNSAYLETFRARLRELGWTEGRNLSIELVGADASVARLKELVPQVIASRADVIVASTSDTLERAKTVGMTIPYFAFQMVVLTREDAGVNSYADLKGKKLGNTSGTYEAIALEKDQKAWGTGSFRAYQSQNDTILAVAQGHIDATVVTNTVAAATLKFGKYKGLKVAGDAPYVVDYVSLAAKRSEYGLLNYLNLFVNQQVRNGRYDELWKKWVGDEIKPANLTVPGVYY